MFKRNLSFCRRYGPIICFKIKNPPTVHSTSRIQPTTSPTFVFSVSASVRKKWGYERKLLDSRFGRSSSCFYSHFIILLKKYDMVAKTFSSTLLIVTYYWIASGRLYRDHLYLWIDFCEIWKIGILVNEV
jgi:hypothetical protein